MNEEVIFGPRYFGPCFDYQGIADYSSVGLGRQREYRHRGNGGNFTVLIGREGEFARAAQACHERFLAARPQDELRLHDYATATPDGLDYQTRVETIGEARDKCARWFGREI